MPEPTHSYLGDTADYGVDIVKTMGNVSSVRIITHDSETCTVPIGAVITVPNRKLI